MELSFKMLASLFDSSTFHVCESGRFTIKKLGVDLSRVLILKIVNFITSKFQIRILFDSLILYCLWLSRNGVFGLVRKL